MILPTLIPLFVLMLLFALPAAVAVYLILRFRKQQLLHKERMAAIEKGLLPPSDDQGPSRVYYRRGMIWLAVGISLSMVIFMFAILVTAPRSPEQALSDRLYQQRRFKMLGATEDQIRQLERDQEDYRRSRPGPEVLAILGLVPAAVGIAYLVFHWQEESRQRQIPPSTR